MLLSKILQKIIEDSVKKSFQSLRLNLLGPDYISKSIHFSFKNFDPATTLGSMYSHANAINSTDPKSIDKSTLNKLKDVAENYVDALQEKSIADMNRIVGEKLDEISAKAKMQGSSTDDILNSKDGQSVLKELRVALKDQRVKIEKAADVIVNHELHNAQNYGAFDGLLSASKSMGIADPYVIKLGVMDEHRCKYCWELWTMPDKITPRVYKLSELTANPGHWKNPGPSISPTHPNCRDILTILMPGFGFVGGKIAYIGKDHNEYNKQRGQ